MSVTILMSGSGPVAALAPVSPAISQVLAVIAIVGVPSAICMGLIAAFTIFGPRR